MLECSLFLITLVCLQSLKVYMYTKNTVWHKLYILNTDYILCPASNHGVGGFMAICITSMVWGHKWSAHYQCQVLVGRPHNPQQFTLGLFSIQCQCKGHTGFCSAAHLRNGVKARTSQWDTLYQSWWSQLPFFSFLSVRKKDLVHVTQEHENLCTEYAQGKLCLLNDSKELFIYMENMFVLCIY